MPTAPKPPAAPPAPGTAPAAPATPAAPPPQPPLPEPEYVPVGGDEAQPASPAPQKEAWSSYTPEEIANAKKELAETTPEDLLHMRDQIVALEVANKNLLNEAGGIAFTELQTERGAKINLTGRGVSATAALINLVEGVKFADHTWGMRPVLRGADFPRQSAPNGGAQAQSSSGQRQTNETGTDVLNFIEVEAPGKKDRTVKFGVGKFKYPFTDARIRNENGAETIAKLFDPSLQWTAAHFSQGFYYDENVCQGLLVDWECVTKGEKKYWNVIRVHA